jgi:hypothetical protein
MRSRPYLTVVMCSLSLTLEFVDTNTLDLPGHSGPDDFLLSGVLMKGTGSPWIYPEEVPTKDQRVDGGILSPTFT